MDNSLAGRVSSINFLPTSGGNVEGGKEKSDCNFATKQRTWAKKKIFLRSVGVARVLINKTIPIVFNSATSCRSPYS